MRVIPDRRSTRSSARGASSATSACTGTSKRNAALILVAPKARRVCDDRRPSAARARGRRRFGTTWSRQSRPYFARGRDAEGIVYAVGRIGERAARPLRRRRRRVVTARTAGRRALACAWAMPAWPISRFRRRPITTSPITPARFRAARAPRSRTSCRHTKRRQAIRSSSGSVKRPATFRWRRGPAKPPISGRWGEGSR